MQNLSVSFISLPVYSFLEIWYKINHLSLLIDVKQRNDMKNDKLTTINSIFQALVHTISKRIENVYSQKIIIFATQKINQKSDI